MLGCYRSETRVFSAALEDLRYLCVNVFCKLWLLRGNYPVLKFRGNWQRPGTPTRPGIDAFYYPVSYDFRYGNGPDLNRFVAQVMPCVIWIRYGIGNSLDYELVADFYLIVLFERDKQGRPDHF